MPRLQQVPACGMCYSVNAQGPDDETAPLPAPAAQVNVNGGAIALGHPLGATGARCTATLLHEMKRRGTASRYGVVSMCIGSGMGAAAVFERGSEVDGLANAGPVVQHNHLSRDARV
jgi:acetyl-CoA acyltransferase 1